MASDRKGFSNSIGSAGGSSQVGSSSISEGDGRSRTPDSERGAGSIIDGPYGAEWGSPPRQAVHCGQRQGHPAEGEISDCPWRLFAVARTN